MDVFYQSSADGTRARAKKFAGGRDGPQRLLRLAQVQVLEHIEFRGRRIEQQALDRLEQRPVGGEGADAREFSLRARALHHRSIPTKRPRETGRIDFRADIFNASIRRNRGRAPPPLSSRT
jgi:hypothetical protein